MNNSNQPSTLLSTVIKGWSRRGGIYQIQCTKTKKTYLGSTGNIIKRLKQHYKLLKTNTHSNKEMQADFNLWGENSFQVCFIKLVHQNYDRNQLYLDEQAYLDVVKSFDVGGHEELIHTYFMKQLHDKCATIEPWKQIDTISDILRTLCNMAVEKGTRDEFFRHTLLYQRPEAMTRAVGIGGDCRRAPRGAKASPRMRAPAV